MLPAVLQWNAAVNAARQKALAEAMAAPGRPAWELVKELIAGLGQPVSLQAVGIKRESLPEIARRALEYHPVKVNPRPIRTAADVMEILELAWRRSPEQERRERQRRARGHPHQRQGGIAGHLHHLDRALHREVQQRRRPDRVAGELEQARERKGQDDRQQHGGETRRARACVANK